MKPIGLAVAYTLREYRGRTRQHQKKKKSTSLHYCNRLPSKQIAWYNRIELTAVKLIIINSRM